MKCKSLVLFLSLSVFGVACDAAAVDSAPAEQDRTGAGGKADSPTPSEPNSAPNYANVPLSHVGQAVLHTLSGDYSGERTSTWNLRADTDLEPGWVVQTPPVNSWGQPAAALPVARCTSNCDADFGLQRCQEQTDCTGGGICRDIQASVSIPGAAPVRMCAGHSDEIYDDIYLGLIQAERFVDITSLSAADGRFEPALRNALTYLSMKGAAIEVRLLFGNIIGQAINASQIRDSLTRDMNTSSPMTVNVAGYRKGFSSWNHSKIIAVDGDWMIQGGHNMWDRDYLEASPIHDISMTVRGPAAEDGHRFANRLWRYACRNIWWSGWTTRASYPSNASDCPAPYSATFVEGSGGIPTFAVGRLGAIGPDPSDAAQMSALRAARNNIKMSLQDIGPISVGPIRIAGWPDALFEELGRAILRDVDVYIALSSPGAAPDGKGSASAGYFNGWSAVDIARRVRDWMSNNGQLVPAGTDINALVCDQLHVANLRMNDNDETWPDGSGYGNHAKFFIVDDAAFYMGSQNLYVANLAEFGLIVDDYAATADVLVDYWEPLWSYSSRTAVTGRTAAECAL